MRRHVYVGFGLTAVLLLGVYYAVQGLLGVPPLHDARSRTYRLLITAPRPGEELPVFKVRQGDAITILLASDRPGEADLHGYEAKVALVADGEVALTFTATDTGLFPLHLHERSAADESVYHRHLASLEVQPR